MSTHLLKTLRRAALVCVAALTPLRASADTANTQAVVDAANAFLATVTTAQKTAIDATTSPVNSSCLYNATLSNVEVWSNLPVSTTLSGTTRNGLMFTNLTTAQQTAALNVATAALGTAGKKLFDDVRAGDRYISGEVTNSKGTKSSMWGYGKYFIAFVGTPSTTGTWTLQLGGHHMAYNITYNGTYSSSTPMFAGTEPNSWTDSTGTYAPLGTQRTLLTQLRPTLTTSALLSGTYSDVVFGPNGSGPGATSGHDTVQPKSYPTTSRGQLYSALTSTQQGLVLSYIQSWINTQATATAAELLAIYTSPQALAETYVGYAGSSTSLSGNANYFRVDGPRLWIEFSVQGGVYDQSSYHDHGIWRDKLADYGAAYGSTTISTTLRPPVISTQPASATVISGGTTALTVASSTTGTLSYQWYQDGTAISGATSATYSASAAGSYYVTILSTGGLTKSSTATVSVTAAQEPLTTFLSTYHLTDADADDDLDGISNTLEFVLGGDPTTSDTSILPTGTYSSSAGTFTYTFWTLDDLGSVTWTCQYSTDLTTWITAVSGTANVLITEGTPVDGYIPVTIVIPATGEQLYVRLAATGL